MAYDEMHREWRNWCDCEGGIGKIVFFRFRFDSRTTCDRLDPSCPLIRGIRLVWKHGVAKLEYDGSNMTVCGFVELFSACKTDGDCTISRVQPWTA